MKKSVNKVLLIIIVVLLLANIAMVFMFVLPSGKRGYRGDSRLGVDSGMSATLREKVGFTQKQISDYLELRSKKRPALKDQFAKLRTTKEQFYFTMYEGNDSSAAKYGDSLAMRQKSVDSTMRMYFIDIRKLCTPEQLPQFDTVMKKMVWKMIGKPGKQKDQSKK